MINSEVEERINLQKIKIKRVTIKGMMNKLYIKINKKKLLYFTKDKKRGKKQRKIYYNHFINYSSSHTPEMISS